MTKDELFWSRAKRMDSGCWEWQGAHSSRGYGSVKWKGYPKGAHQVSFLLTFGFVGKSTCHRCDNPSCVSPFHLFAGDQKANIADCVAKGRKNSKRGTQCSWARLTEAQVSEILYLSRYSDLTRRQIANAFGITRGSVDKIRQRKRWKHVQIPEPHTQAEAA